jgi:hypothetical protein
MHIKSCGPLDESHWTNFGRDEEWVLTDKFSELLLEE